MVFPRARVAALSALLAAALVPAPAQAMAPLVTQGDTVTVAGRGACTIGFNDPSQRVSYTAGHCGENGERVVAGTDAFGPQATGTFHPSSEWGKSSTGNDWGIIRWDDTVRIGPNRYTDDVVVSPADVQAGDRVCMFGAASKSKLCGPYSGRVHNNVYWDGPVGVPGDSGGPVWVEGRGLLGVYSGISIISDSTGREARLLRASKPKNGPGVSGVDEIEFIGTVKPLEKPVSHTAEVPDPGQAGGSGPTVRPAAGAKESEGSSSSVGSALGSIAAVAVILIGALVAALPLLADFAV